MSRHPAFLSSSPDIDACKLAEHVPAPENGPGAAMERVYLRAFQAAPQPMAVVDQHGVALALNDAFVRELGYTLAEVPTIDDYMKLVFTDTSYGRQTIQEWAESGRRYLESQLPQEPIVSNIRCRDGVVRTFEVRTTWTLTEAFVTFLDVTDRRAGEERLRLWNSVMRSTAEGILVCDPRSRIIAVNPAFERITGYTEAEVVGQTPAILHSGRQGPDFYTMMWRAMHATGQWSGEIWNRRKDGGVYAEWLALNAVLDTAGNVTHYVGVFSDITEHKQQEQHLRHLALFDVLTDLPNRAQLLQRLEHALELATRRKHQLAVLFVDLDRFKEINDSMGHEAGDLLLREIATRLRSVARQSDTVARMGGDEFVVLLEDLCSGDDAARVAAELLRQVARPVTLQEQEVSISASIGIGLYPDDGTSASDLMRNADTAMYGAKHNGRNRYVFYAREMNEHATVRLRMENDLRRAIEKQELVLHFQPQFDLGTGAIIGAEALVRWNRPGFGLLPPDQFIPMAEECGLIGAIDAWVFEEALRQTGSWDSRQLPGITIAVNVSPPEFHEPGFVERIRHSIAAYGLPAGRVELEITEGIVMRDVESSKRVLNALHELGVRLSVDDFGTGYSSLSYLRHFSVDKLKIDKSFIAESDDPKIRKLIRAIIAFADSLDIRTNAEGVENLQQLQLLRELGCDEIQGFLASLPVGAEEFERLLRAPPVLP
jgi:diguanylate cyclase (GGDEF)-like protein/PAS domain S-box-containing protein